MPTNARAACKEVIRNSVPDGVWKQNVEFSAEILDQIKSHSLTKHPLIQSLSQSQLDADAMRLIHLEFRYAFSLGFTDALLHAMLRADELEERYGASGKMSARFMLQFNLLDELGFEAGNGTENYTGSPERSHYVMFNNTLRDLGITEAQANAHQPIEASKLCRKLIEASYADYVEVVTVLSVIETIFEAFAGPWSKNMRTNTDVKVDGGYHSIHVDAEGSSVDDDHAEDLWYVFRQALTADRYDDVRAKTNETLDALLAFVEGIAASAA